jgi:hypothetical protein
MIVDLSLFQFSPESFSLLLLILSRLVWIPRVPPSSTAMRLFPHHLEANALHTPSAPHDERAPLLAKIDNETAQDSIHDDLLLAKIGHDEPNRNKLWWAMASVWLGTFCAGLGEHRRNLHILARRNLLW